MTENINTTISATTTFFDLDGNIVPTGNYYFNVKNINGNEYTGDLIQKGKYGEFKFKARDLVKMMSVPAENTRVDKKLELTKTSTDSVRTVYQPDEHYVRTLWGHTC